MELPTNLFDEMFVKKSGELTKGFASFRYIIATAELCVALAFINIEIRLNTSPAQLTVRAHGIA